MECLKTIYLAKHDINVPCGKCAFCMATRRSDWSTRIHFERKLHRHSQFVTLTYKDKYLTHRSGHSQLVKSDLQKWFKRVRKAGYKFRYYAVGEYGSHTYRPHYHILVFGYVPEQVVRESWEFGMVHIGQVNGQSVLYCLKYMVNSKEVGMRNNRTRPFATMSRKPGLGANYLTPDMIAWHKSDRKNYVMINDQKLHLPRYYKGKIFSKIDHVRIAVRDGKKAFDSLRKELYRLRRIGDAKKVYAYVEDRKRIAALRIREKSKQNLTI